MKIKTSFDYPPIPDRSMDWSAIDDDTYDVDFVDGRYVSLGPVGHGATEQEAIADLEEQIRERDFGRMHDSFIRSLSERSYSDD